MITYGFFNSVSGDRKYNAEQLSEFFGGLVGNGIFENVGQRFVIKAETNDLTVSVGTGRAFINSHWIKNDAKFVLNLNVADVQYPRIDDIVIRLDENARSVEIDTKTGTPASSPQPPTLTRSNGVYELCLAQIYVAAGATAISQTNITDTRANSALCGWVTGLIDQVDTEELFLQWDAAYEAQYQKQTNEFNSWFETLTKQLNVNTKLVRYQNTVITTLETNEVNIGIPQYKQDDILLVHVGGVLFIEKDEYTVIGEGEAAKIRLVNTIKENNPVTFVVIKSQVGGEGAVPPSNDDLREIFSSYFVLFNADSIPLYFGSLTTIPTGIIWADDTSIKTMFIPDRVTKVQAGAFELVDNLTQIYVNNTADNITFEAGAIPEGTEVIYNDNQMFNMDARIYEALASLDRRATTLENPVTATAQGADFAEVANWTDGNPDGEDRLYRFVSITDEANKKITIANKSSQIVGISNIKDNVGFLSGYQKGDEEDKSKAIVSVLGVAPVKYSGSNIYTGDRVISDANGYAVKSPNEFGYKVLEHLGNGLINVVVSPNTDVLQRIEANKVQTIDFPSSDYYPSTSAVWNFVNSKIETGTIAETYAWYADDTSKKITGTYQLVGNFCTISATVDTINGWGVVYYSLPVPMLHDAFTVAYSTGSNQKYFIRSGIVAEQTLLAITTFDGSLMSTDEKVSFTLTYKYQ